MSNDIVFKIDGVQVKGKTGQTIMDAADQAGIYIPRLCDVEGLAPQGSCRVCTVKVNGRPAAPLHLLPEARRKLQKTDQWN